VLILTPLLPLSPPFPFLRTACKGPFLLLDKVAIWFFSFPCHGKMEASKGQDCLRQPLSPEHTTNAVVSAAPLVSPPRGNDRGFGPSFSSGDATVGFPPPSPADIQSREVLISPSLTQEKRVFPLCSKFRQRIITTLLFPAALRLSSGPFFFFFPPGQERCLLPCL